MGSCDSSERNIHLKENLSQDRTKLYGEFPSNFSSSSLPTMSSSFSINQKKSEIHKKNNSFATANSLENKQYLLPESICKRQDITKKYKLSKKILGDGATSLVYIGENSATEKFAIKRISKAKMTLRQNIVIKEAEICKKLNHTNIIKYYELYEDINFINIVMELGDTDLFELISNSPTGVIPDEFVLDFLIQIFEVIDYLHNSQNLVHCDLKPENFVVKFDKKTQKIILKLIDFGNVRNKPINKERLYNFFGTKEYMAPETIDNYGFNEKVDEWAAGIIMYNMLTGTYPFNTDDENYSDYKDEIKFKEINFDRIENECLRELNKKLLNKFMIKRISAKEALEEIKRIKNDFYINNSKKAKKDKNFFNFFKNDISLENIY